MTISFLEVLYEKIIAMLLSFTLAVGLCACANNADSSFNSVSSDSSVNSEQTSGNEGDKAVNTTVPEKEYIEQTLNLANNADQEWTYNSASDAWTLSVVSAVAYPELQNQQGVSVCVPGAYVIGIDTDGDKNADITADTASGAVKGALMINYDAKITSANGQVYTAATAPVILNTGAAGYSSQNNSAASAAYSADGYINVSCGNHGKQYTVTDDNENTYYTGDAPSCLID